MVHANSFTWADYAVFALMLSICLTIGVVFGIVNRKKKSSGDFLLGGGDLHVVPVGFSILASFISAIAILGYSGEMYRYGTMYYLIVISHIIVHCLVALIYIPFYHQLDITTAYQYLEQRFSYSVRLTCSVLFVCQMFLYMAVALYTPALAIGQVTGLPLIPSIIGTGVICAIYTVVGGLKATVWIDLLQMGIMFLGLFILLIKGIFFDDDVKSFSEMWYRAEMTDRVEFFTDFDLNPFKRHTFWTLIIGGVFTNLSMYAGNQGSVQRYLSVKSWKKASMAMMISMCGIVTVLTVICLCGLLAFAKYYDCDILKNGTVQRMEQIIPYLVLDILGKAPGVPGLFVAAVYGAALSSISGAMNSLAAVTITDFVKPSYFYFNKRCMKESVEGYVTKLLALGYGIGGIGMAYLCQYAGKTILQLALSIFGLLGGPIFAVISLGMFVPYANWLGALIGLVASAGLNLWMGLGGILYPNLPIEKKVSLVGCPGYNASSIYSYTPAITHKSESYEGLYIYQLSYLHYSTFAVIVVFVVGIFMSFITYDLGIVKRREIDPKYFFSFSRTHTANKVKEFSTIGKSNAILLDDFEKIQKF